MSVYIIHLYIIILIFYMIFSETAYDGVVQSRIQFNGLTYIPIQIIQCLPHSNLLIEPSILL